MTCPFRRNGDTASLDDPIVNEDGEETTWLDQLADPSPLISDIVADTERMTQLFLKLNELMPQAIEIGRLRLQGLSDDAIAERIGVARTTSASRIKKVKSILAEEFAEFF